MNQRRSTLRFPALAALAVLASPLLACTLITKTDDTQCSTNDDCRKRGAAFASAVCVANACQVNGALSCIGSAKAQPTPPPGNVKITMSFFDEVSNTKQLAGVTVRACSKLDVTCASPLPNSTATSDAQGNATFTLPAGFDGYLEINGSSTMSALWYFSPFPVTDGTYNVGLLSPNDFQLIAQTSGATIDANAGHSFNLALDCTAKYGTFTAGMSFDADKKTSGTRPFYVINGLPSTTATATDASGIGGFANLPPGVVTVTATLQSTGARSGSASVLIRTGVITYSPIAPGP
jgi:hypothetical protein